MSFDDEFGDDESGDKKKKKKGRERGDCSAGAK